jgi:hypothetical protein
MDCKSGSSGISAALQAQSPEFKSQCQPKKQKLEKKKVAIHILKWAGELWIKHEQTIGA